MITVDTRGAITGKSVVVLAYPLNDQAGKLIGAVGLPTDLANFKFVAGSAGLSPDANIGIVTGDGTVVASLRNAGTLVGKDMRGAEIVAIVLAQKRGVARARSVSGIDRIYGFRPIPGADWYVLAGIPVSLMFANMYNGAWQSAIAASLAVLLALLLALVLARVVSRPLRAAVATALQAAGARFAIDDFGTGYSNLSYLKRFPIDVIKIDRSFVRDIMTDPDDAAITLAIISMAHQLGLKVVAEGVETLEQLDFLRANACDEIQGYFFSRPVSAADFTERLRERQKKGASLTGR